MSPPLSICHLGKYYPPARGGIETHVAALARGQSAAGHRVSVLCANHPGPPPPRGPERDGAVEVERLPSLGRAAGMDLCPGVLRALATRARAADIVHLHVPNPLFIAGLALTGWRGRLVITHHSDVVRQRILGRALRPLDSHIYRRADVLLSDSPTYIEGSPLLRMFRRKTEVLPLGLDLERFSRPSEASLRYKEDLAALLPGPLWLIVGRLVYYKGIETALRALRDVSGSLLVVGSGPLGAAMKASARDWGLESRIRWEADLDDERLAGAYQAATALWFPSDSRAEGFGLVQVEAMASGCPVINTRIPQSGVSWVSPDGVSGLTIAPGDAAGLAAAARRLSEDSGLRSTLSAGAKARASLEFDARTMARRSLALYARLTGGKGASP